MCHELSRIAIIVLLFGCGMKTGSNEVHAGVSYLVESELCP